MRDRTRTRLYRQVICRALCPACGGDTLTTNDDGWKICYACGYSSPA